jgi:hypothetical protein
MSEPTDPAHGRTGRYSSLALALSAKAGAAIWWAGTQNTRLTTLETRVAELLSTSPLYHNQVVEADRRIAVIDGRIVNIIARIEALTAALERRHGTP